MSQASFPRQNSHETWQVKSYHSRDLEIESNAPVKAVPWRVLRTPSQPDSNFSNACEAAATQRRLQQKQQVVQRRLQRLRQRNAIQRANEAVKAGKGRRSNDQQRLAAQKENLDANEVMGSTEDFQRALTKAKDTHQKILRGKV